MNELSQSEVEQQVLRVLFDTMNKGVGWLSPGDVAGGMNGVSAQRAQMALRVLERAGQVRARHNYVSGSTYEISEAGYAQLERGNSVNVSIENNLVPASDRIVRIDHNQPAYRDTYDATLQLKSQLQTSNDLGELGVDDALAAAHEVSQIAETLEQPVLRPAALWSRAKDTLGWIGREAAGAAVGAAALALLALLAALLGFAP